jgi:hypothetical protein
LTSTASAVVSYLLTDWLLLLVLVLLVLLLLSLLPPLLLLLLLLMPPLPTEVCFVVRESYLQVHHL